MGSRTEEEAVHRVLAKEFRGWSMQALSTKGSDGQACLSVVKEAVATARANSRRIQPEFWGGVRLQYRQCRVDRKQLQVQDRNQAINPRLNTAWQAMHAGATGKKNVHDLEYFFKTATGINQRELVCSLKIVVDPPCLRGRAACPPSCPRAMPSGA